ncbi:alpha-2,8-sialyltransferase 8E [Nematolebias whitei]|uniref:alpha-2,8-sialyltransferase 8E n=1 Tax=Nematolebias whitei TaxID=451745 RepID=UPI00189BCC85|nr:alpha-2,8-sialyltransferase 8E [Nematolebias whitei]
MRGHLLWLMVGLSFLGSLLITLAWFTLDNKNVDPHRRHLQPKGSCKNCWEDKNKVINVCSQTWKKEGKHQKSSKVEAQPPEIKTAPQVSASCKDCRKKIKKLLEFYVQDWKKDERDSRELRSQLSGRCNGSEKAIVTQTNTPLGTKLVYDGEKKRTHEVNQETFSTFPNENPFSNKTWHTCSVVGNSGIMANSSCGKSIDSSQFVIRCNLPPLLDRYEKDVGVKTNLVTANPSILWEKYGALMGRRSMFVEKLCQYDNSLLLLPAFSFSKSTAISIRALYTIEDFGSPIQPVFLNPVYLQSMALFWRPHGLKAPRLSTGFMMVSLALELCENVNLYGFWPFSVHPYNFTDLTNHYYDDKKPNVNIHFMPEEFKLLVKLHSQGVLRMHLGDCKPESFSKQKENH